MRERKDKFKQLQQANSTTFTLGQRIRLVRGNNTQTDFGKLLEKSQDIISVYEADAVEPPVDILAKIAELGNVTIVWLAYGHSSELRKNSIVFEGRILKPKTPEWRILEIMTGLSSEKIKDKIVELVDSYIKLEKK